MKSYKTCMGRYVLQLSILFFTLLMGRAGNALASTDQATVLSRSAISHLGQVEQDMREAVKTWREKPHGDWKRTGSSWKAKGVEQAKKARDAVEARLKRGGQALQSDTARLKDRATALTDSEKTRLSDIAKKQGKRLKAWRTAHPRDSHNLDDLISQTKNDVVKAFK